MKTYLLDEYLPSITSNVMLTVDDDFVRLNPMITNLSLSNSKLKDVVVSLNNTYSKDIKEYMSVTDGIDFYDDAKYNKKGYRLCPLWIVDSIPDSLVFFKKNSVGFGNNTIVKRYSLKAGTVIGDYLRKHLLEIDQENPISINAERNTFSIYGINSSAGTVQYHTFGYNKTDVLDKLVLEKIKLNKIMIPNLINIEFKIDEDYDTCVYCNEGDIYKIHPSIYRVSDYLPIYYNKEIKRGDFDNTDNNTTGNNIKFVNSKVPFVYARCGEQFMSVIEKDGMEVYDNDFQTDLVYKTKIDISPLNRNKNIVLYKLKEKFKHNDFIDVSVGMFGVTLCADYLPAYNQVGTPIFVVGEHIEHIFNPSGSKNDGMNAFIGSFNEMVGSHFYLEARVVGDYIMITGDVGGNENAKLIHPKLEEISTGISKLYNTDSFLVDREVFEPIKDSILYLKNEHGSYKILDYKPYCLNIGKAKDGSKYFIDLDKYYIINTPNIIGSKNFTYLSEPQYPTVGIFDVFDTKLLNTSIMNFRKNINDEEAESLFKPKSLVIGKKYYVGGIDNTIIHKGIHYNSNQSFIASHTEYVVSSGVGFVVDEVYWNDPIVKSIMESYDNVLSTTTNVGVSWQAEGSTDLYYNKANTKKNFSPAVEKVPTISGNTNEWYVPSFNPKNISSEKYLKSRFDVKKHLSDRTYFDKIVGSNFSEIIDINGVMSTVFKGVEVKFNITETGYRFSSILNLHTEDDYVDGDKYSIIQNDVNKTIVFLIDIYITDYKFKDIDGDHFYFSMLYFMKNCNRDRNNVGYTFSYPYPNPLPARSFTGIKLPLQCTSSIGDRLLFRTKMFLDNLIFPNENGNINIIGLNRIKKTVLSNVSYDGTLPIKKVSFDGNNMYLDGNSIYAHSLDDLGVNDIRSLEALDNHVIWKDIEWYQLDGGHGAYNGISDMLNFSTIKEVLNLDKPYITKIKLDKHNSVYNDAEEISISINSAQDIYSGEYTLSTKTIKTYEGDLINNSWRNTVDNWRANVSIKWNELPTIHSMKGKLKNINDNE